MKNKHKDSVINKCFQNEHVQREQKTTRNETKHITQIKPKKYQTHTHKQHKLTKTKTN